MSRPFFANAQADCKAVLRNTNEVSVKDDTLVADGMNQACDVGGNR